MLLNGIICQMNKLIVQIINIEFFTTRSNICIFIEVAFQMPIDRSHGSITSKIELSVINQQRIVNIFLNNVSLLFVLTRMSFLDKIFNLIKIWRHINSISSISILTRLYNPHILWYSVFSLYFFDFFILFIEIILIVAIVTRIVRIFIVVITISWIFWDIAVSLPFIYLW